MTRWPLSDTEIERISRAREKLNRRDPLNIVVDALLQNTDPPPGSAKIILHTLETRRAKRHSREIAGWAAGLVPMSQDEAQAINGKLIQILERRPQGAKTHCTAAACCLVIWPTLVLLPLWIHLDRSENRVRELAAVSLGRLGFNWNVMPLCEAIRTSVGQTAGARDVGIGAAYGLALVLRLMGSRAVGVLDEPTERVLGNMLREPSSVGAWSILEIFKLTGSSRSIRFVQQFLKRSSDSGLVSAANETLKALDARRLLETQKASLLRPSDAPADPNTLLRAYDSKQSAEEHLLLRPEEGPE